MHFGTSIIDTEDYVWIFSDKYPTKPRIRIFSLKAKQISTGLAGTLIIDLNNNVWKLNNLDDNPGHTQFQAKQISVGTHMAIIDLEDNIFITGITNYNVFDTLGYSQYIYDDIKN